MDSRNKCLNASNAGCRKHTGSAGWLSLHQPPAMSRAQVNWSIQMDGEIYTFALRRTDATILQIRAFIQRALHFRSHSCCYRGCILHLHHDSLRVDLNVVSFLECQIICFLPVCPCPRVWIIMLSCAFMLRNPSAFSVMTCCMCINQSLYFNNERVSHSGTLRLHARVRKLQKSMNLCLESEIVLFRLVSVL